MAVAAFKPSELPKEALAAPASDLSLEWVYAYGAPEVSEEPLG
jgi:hypothetical protein